MIKAGLYGIKYLAQYKILGVEKPLICGLVLHNTCNLKCMHCTIHGHKTMKMSFEEAKNVIDKFYDKGGRCLYLEGGEPLIWNENGHGPEDIIQYAKNKGYLSTIVYTNGTVSLNSKADTIFVSIDGMPENHNRIRGNSFERIIRNIRDSDHASIFVNYTINSINKNDIEDFCRFIDSEEKIRGVFFYFHTPYYGMDELYIGDSEKIEILNQLIELSGKHKILNSKPGLRRALKNDWRKKMKICQVYEGGKYYDCCRENHVPGLCDNCGYLSYAEIHESLKLKPGTLLNALKYF